LDQAIQKPRLSLVGAAATAVMAVSASWLFWSAGGAGLAEVGPATAAIWAPAKKAAVADVMPIRARLTRAFRFLTRTLSALGGYAGALWPAALLTV
jgi:hypothetical protein